MAYCTKCGKRLSDNAERCPNCGLKRQTTSSTVDDGSGLWGLLGFCFPIVGLVLYAVWINNQPNNAKSAGTGALIGFILSFIIAFFRLALFS